ncbi:MAG: hypothetical protein LQ338_001813 [Usnochroma carphineum]|nr:MAG: hypothetical protein LQ338_001813 [Usnochroma carphineum]
MDVLPPSTPDRSRAPPAFRRSFTVPRTANASLKQSPPIREAVEEEAETLYAHNAGKIVSFNPPITGTRRHSSVEQGYSALQDEPVGILPWASTTERTLAAEKPKTPIRKKPWRPRERPQSALTTERSDCPERELRCWERSSTLLEQRAAADLRPEGEEDTLAEYTDSVPEDSAESSELGQDRKTTDDSEITPKNHTSHGRQDIDPYKTPTRPRPLKTGRATTAPPQLLLHTALPSDTATQNFHCSDRLEEESNLSSSIDSFHSFHSPISPLPPSPRFPQHSSSPDPIDGGGITNRKVRNHRRDNSELTVTAESEDIWSEAKPTALQEAVECASLELPCTPPLVSDTTSLSEEPSPEAITPLSFELRRRTKLSRQRSHSPLPSPANIYSPRSRLSRHHLTTMILQKTASMLLGPPVSLVALMLNIASRIMNGTYNGFPFGSAESGRKIPCSWDFSDTDQMTEEEDDYGCALDKLPSSRSSSRSKDLGCEID